MDRLYRKLTGCGLALTLALPGAGCHHTRSEVPAGRHFSGDGRSQPPVGFSSGPNADPLSTMPAPGAPGGPGVPGVNSGAGQYGIPAPGAGVGSYGAPTSNTYGPVGSAPTTTTTTTPGATGPAPSLGADPSAGIPQSGTGSTGPAAGIGAPNQGQQPLQGPNQSPF